MKHKKIDTVWSVYTYDVWGNAKDGYEVNDRYSHGKVELRLNIERANEGTPQEFEHASPSDLQIKNALDCKPRIKIDTEGDDLTIYVNHASTGYPLGELHCISHESLSPIRLKTVPPKPIPFDKTTIPDTAFGKFASKYCKKQEQTVEGLRAILAKQKEEFMPDGWFMLECQMLDSSSLGQLTILPYGPNNTFKTIPDHPVSPRGLASDMSTVVASLSVIDLSPIREKAVLPEVKGNDPLTNAITIAYTGKGLTLLGGTINAIKIRENPMKPNKNTRDIARFEKWRDEFMQFPNQWGLKPYRFSFTVGEKRHVWIRFYPNIHLALADCKYHVNMEYPLFAHSFLIESDQDDEGIRKSWGL